MITSTNHSVAVTLWMILDKSDKNYIVPSVKAIIGRLSERHKTQVKRRRVFYAIRYLLDQQYIRRRSRYRKDMDGRIRQEPGMITFTLKGLYYLWNNGVSRVVRMISEMKKAAKKVDRRFPRPQDIEKEFEEIDRNANLKEVKKLLASFS